MSKTEIITGGSSGRGTATAAKLSEAGFTVFASDLSPCNEAGTHGG